MKEATDVYKKMAKSMEAKSKAQKPHAAFEQGRGRSIGTGSVESVILLCREYYCFRQKKLFV